MKTIENKSERMQFYWQENCRPEGKRDGYDSLFGWKWVHTTQFTAGTSCGECVICSDDNSASGPSAMKRLRIPCGSTRNVCPPALGSCRSSLSRLLSWCWDTENSSPCSWEDRGQQEWRAKVEECGHSVPYTHWKLSTLETDLMRESASKLTAMEDH